MSSKNTQSLQFGCTCAKTIETNGITPSLHIFNPPFCHNTSIRPTKNVNIIGWSRPHTQHHLYITQRNTSYDINNKQQYIKHHTTMDFPEDDFNTTLTRIDCTPSKKRKQASIDKYTNYALRKHLRESEYGERVQRPPSGKHQDEQTELGKIESFVPIIRGGYGEGTIHWYKPSIWHLVKKPYLGGTTIPLKLYNKYLTDTEYVVLEHKKLIGMMREWKLTVLESIKELEEEWGYSWQATRDQYKWCQDYITPMMIGIQNFKLIPVGCLNKQTVISLVDGIDEEEKADLVINMGKCEKYEIACVRHDRENNCSIITIFDDNHKHKVAYGKKQIINLSHKPSAIKDE
jgi:hypothetical protein